MAQAELSDIVTARGSRFALHGRYDTRFRPVVDAFLANFREEDELGAAVSVVIDGKTVINLWGGWARADHTREWDAHSTVCMMSVAKGVTGIAFNMCIDRGLIDIDKPVAHYWPEFAQNGKEDILVRWVLDHRAAIPVLTTDVMQPGGFFDYHAFIRALEVQEPLWEPGTRAAYHVHNQGFPAWRDHAAGDRQDRRSVPARTRHRAAGGGIIYRRDERGGAGACRGSPAQYRRAPVRRQGPEPATEAWHP